MSQPGSYPARGNKKPAAAAAGAKKKDTDKPVKKEAGQTEDSEESVGNILSWTTLSDMNVLGFTN